MVAIASTSTQSQVVDLITQKVMGLNLANLIGLPCPVFDGPEGTDVEDNYVVIHATPNYYTSEWVSLPARAIDEVYGVTIAVLCYQGGDNPPNVFDQVNDVQAIVRANCKLIAAAIQTAVQADITLAIQNGGSPPTSPFWTSLTAQPLDQTPPEDAAPMGRFARIDMVVTCHSRLNIS
jgi:hypothetical protein